MIVIPLFGEFYCKVIHTFGAFVSPGNIMLLYERKGRSYYHKRNTVNDVKHLGASYSG